MSITIQNSFENGTNGAAFTTSSSSGTNTNPAAVSLGSGSAATYSSVKGSPQSGTLALALSYTTSTGYAEFAFNPAVDTDRVAFRTWVWYPSGGGLQRILIFRNTGNIAYVSVESSGALTFTDAGATVQITSGSTLFPTNQWILVQGAVTIGGSATSGKLELRWSTLASPNTAAWTGSTVSTANLGTAGMTGVRLGMSSAATASHTAYFDDFLVTDGLPSGLPGPAGGGGVASGAGSLSATGVLAAGPTVAAPGTGPLSTSGTLSVTSSAIIGGNGRVQPAFFGSGTLSTVGKPGPKRSPVFTAQGVLLASAYGHLKVFTGAKARTYGAQVWNGEQWITKPVKHWTGTGWTPTSY